MQCRAPPQLARSRQRKGWIVQEGKQGGLELLVFIYAGGGEDNVIADLKDVDVCQIIISVWRCNIKGQLGNTITIKF